MNLKQNPETLIKTVHYEWNELMRDTENTSITFRVICSIATHSGLSVEGSHIFTIHNIFHAEDKNALALTSESAAYNNAIQCLTAAFAFSGQTLPAMKE
ncbi:hypothetical protein [Serratia sp. AKBS12]|uniref:hypothetical protein n=1 Tax=Serratia sp. AKBS12 TaxID=2974597 RepID=UPI0021666C72|nr:hypothetical protein [Serratia sp. AKBS12]MCS3408376.1 hypothetical protein [Serratia sp. AKBS12]